MKWNVIDPESRKYYRKPNGSAEWELTRSQALEISDHAIVIALDERNFNESLNVYWQQKLFEQLHYDEHLGWVS
ncbi:MAG: hypothetical protein IJ087_01270 [Eggerthellaceae bacterium]|nr:hypothetical protein [Eggerthellaceae bacterium]